MSIGARVNGGLHHRGHGEHRGCTEETQDRDVIRDTGSTGAIDKLLSFLCETSVSSVVKNTARTSTATELEKQL
jgi:hypothetical protein